MMDIKSEVGETAGKVWHTLSNDGPQTLALLKKKINDKPEFLNFAIGWLAREDKVEIIPQKKDVQIRLKE